MTTRRLLALAHNGVARAECDAGGLWTVEQVLSGQDVRCLEVDPLNREVIYAGAQGQGVFRSEDGGRSWRPAGLQGVIIKSLAASPHQPGVVYAGTKSPPLMYRTQDGGCQWEELTSFRRVRGRWLWVSPAEPPYTAYVIALAISPSEPNVVLAGVELGAVVRSADGGQTPLLASDPVAPGQLYLASGHGEVWHSADYGDSWQQLPVDLGDVWFKLVVSY